MYFGANGLPILDKNIRIGKPFRQSFIFLIPPYILLHLSLCLFHLYQIFRHMHNDNITLTFCTEFWGELIICFQDILLFICIEDILFTYLIRQYLYLLEIWENFGDGVVVFVDDLAEDYPVVDVDLDLQGVGLHGWPVHLIYKYYTPEISKNKNKWSQLRGLLVFCILSRLVPHWKGKGFEVS